jgi:hypothetical protein
MDQAIYKDVPVDILIVYNVGDVKHATVRAIEGKPFLAWGKFPTKTSYATTTLDELRDIIPDPEPEPAAPNLLSLVLEHRYKQQWHAGEAVWLWGDRQCGAFLKEVNCAVNLYLVGVSHGVTIFILDLHTRRWDVSRTSGADYHQWVDFIKAHARYI